MTATVSQDDQLIDVNQCAMMIGASVATFLRRVDDGSMPRPLKIGRLSRWPRSEILACIEEAKAARAAA